MLYSAVETVTNGVICRLALATTKNPASYNAWTRYGPIFPDVNGTQWSKSGALLIRNSGLSYLFYGDSSYVPGLQLATTADLIHYQQVAGVWMPIVCTNYCTNHCSITMQLHAVDTSILIMCSITL
jgi:hypothetical protein